MTKKAWLILALLAAVFAVMIAHGVRAGDADTVKKNAENFCFS